MNLMVIWDNQYTIFYETLVIAVSLFKKNKLKKGPSWKYCTEIQKLKQVLNYEITFFSITYKSNKAWRKKKFANAHICEAIAY